MSGIIASLLGLQSPEMPVEADSSMLMIYYLLESPILALALALIAGGISGRFLTRALILFFFTWVAYSLNTVLDALVFMVSSTVSSSLFSVISFLVPSFLCGMAVAFFFPPDNKDASFTGALKEFFAQRTKNEWLWRISIAASPVYLLSLLCLFM